MLLLIYLYYIGGFAVKHIVLIGGQITLNIIDGSHITVPAKNNNEIEHNNQIFFWIWKQIVFFIISGADLNKKIMQTIEINFKKFLDVPLFLINFWWQGYDRWPLGLCGHPILWSLIKSRTHLPSGKHFLAAGILATEGK